MNALQNWARARAELARHAADSIVGVEDAGGRMLSGIAWDSATVVTAAAGLERGPLTLHTESGASPADVVAVDPATDVAVLRSAPANPPAARPATRVENAPPHVGQPVVLAGRDARGPVILWSDLARVELPGQARADAPIVRWLRLPLRIEGALQGAGIFDVDGALCAMAVAGPRHRALGIPVEVIAGVVARVAQHGYLPRPFLGVRLQPVWLDDSQGKRFGRGRGLAAVVTGVEADSPAARAGLLFGDFVLALGERPVGRPAAFAREIGAASIGSELTLEVLRGGARQCIAVTVGERPRA